LSKLLKSKKSGAGANDIYKPALRWFEQADTFLRPVTEARPSKSNLVSINLVFKIFLNSEGELCEECIDCTMIRQNHECLQFIL